MGKRELTKKELARKELFEQNCVKLKQEGYGSKEITVNIVKANIYSLFTLLPFVLFFIWLYIKVNQEFYFGQSMFWSMMCLPVFFLLVFAHECIHAIVFGIFAKKHFKSVEIGIVWRYITPYCACKETLTKWQYILGMAMPTIILGFVPAVIAVFLNSFELFFMSILMISCGGGDFLIILMILLYKENGQETVYLDHPYEVGVVVFEK